MFQDIFPKKFNNQYMEKKPKINNYIFYFKDNNVLIKNSDNEINYPTYCDFEKIDAEYTYLFTIDNDEFFIIDTSQDISIDGFSFININIFRSAKPKFKAFAGITAYHLSGWYHDNKFCGRCGELLKHDNKERMLFCSNCQNTVYPKICPVIIVAITDKDKLLMTKYAHREYTKYALVAGFVEIGESAEEAVKREVMEEVGLEVKNITYYKSQPWGYSGSLIVGYFAELNGDSKITLDENELSEAKWFTKDEIQVENNDLSITNELICRFVNSK